MMIRSLEQQFNLLNNHQYALFMGSKF